MGIFGRHVLPRLALRGTALAPDAPFPIARLSAPTGFCVLYVRVFVSCCVQYFLNILAFIPYGPAARELNQRVLIVSVCCVHTHTNRHKQTQTDTNRHTHLTKNRTSPNMVPTLRQALDPERPLQAKVGAQVPP